MNAARFSLGHVFVTPGVAALIEGAEDLKPLLARHLSGDWGDVCDEDKQANEDALRYGSRLLSRYQLKGEDVWIITEADRTVTTVLLPEEY